MCLPAARAERVNKGKRRVNRIAESSGGVRDKDHRYSPSYTSTATSCKHPGRSKHPTRGRVIGTGMYQNPNQPITSDMTRMGDKKSLGKTDPQRMIIRGHLWGLGVTWPCGYPSMKRREINLLPAWRYCRWSTTVEGVAVRGAQTAAVVMGYTVPAEGGATDTICVRMRSRNGKSPDHRRRLLFRRA